MKRSAPSELLALALTLLLAWLPVQAQAAPVQSGFKHYITDQLEVPVRRGPGFNYKIINLLKSGTPVTVLEVNDKGWARIQFTYKGRTREGWMPARLLSNQPVARMQLKALQQKNAELNARLQQLQQQQQQLHAELDDTRKQLGEAQKKLFTLRKEYTHLRQVAGNAVALDEENQKLKTHLRDLEQENAMLKEQIAHSEDAVKRQWFLTGAGVLLLGLLLGRFMRAPRRRSSWSSDL